MSQRPTDVDLVVTERTGGTGRPVLVLHGGGGPATVAPLVEHLAATHPVLAPTLPGWDGTARPDWLDDVDDLALALLGLLAERGLRDVAVVGSSFGGWVAAAMAVLDADAGRVARVVLLDAVGIEVPGQPMADFFALDARGLAEHAWYDPDKGYRDPAAMDDAARARAAAGAATMRVFAGDPYMHDPHLVHRLGGVAASVLGVWGEADRIVTPEYGRAYTAAFARSRFEVVQRAGHLPHLEAPDAVFALLDPFLAADDDATTAAAANGSAA